MMEAARAIVRRRLALPRLPRLVVPGIPPAWAHTIRVVVGVWLALYLAYYLQLDSPYWAATTVALVAHPVRGALFSKALWRVLGTIVGAAAMVGLAAAFPQQPVLFMTGAAVWLGLFTFLASLLQYFRAYGAVLAGFTVCLIGFGAVEHPQTIFNLALARVAAVTIGVLAAALVSVTFHGGIGESTLQARLASQIGAVARLLRRRLHGQPDAAADSEQAQISLELAGMDEAIAFASVESFDIRRRATSLRTGVAELFGALAGGSQTMRMLQLAAAEWGGAEWGAAKGATAIVDAALKQCEQLSQAADAGAALLAVTRTARDQLAELMLEPTGRQPAHETEIMALAQAQDLLDRLSGAARSIAAGGDDTQPGPLRLRAWLDWRTAFRNGMRAMIALGLGSLVWIVTAWPSGGSMLAMLGVICGLLATNQSAAAASVDFAKGVVLAVLCAFVCTFGLLTQVTGFPLLALALLPFVAGSAYASTRPRLAPVVIPMLIFFMPMVGATNPMHYDLAAFFNTAFAYVCGSICAALAFRIVLPPNAGLNVRLLCQAIGRDVARLGRPGAAPNRLVWEHLQHQKLVRLIGRMSGTDADRRGAVVEDACAAIAAGSAAIRVRTALQAGTLAAPVAAAAERALGLLRDLRARPEAAATRSRELAQVLAARDAGETDPAATEAAETDVSATQQGELVHLAGAFAQIGALLQQHQRFFRDPGAAFQGGTPC